MARRSRTYSSSVCWEGKEKAGQYLFCNNVKLISVMPCTTLLCFRDKIHFNIFQHKERLLQPPLLSSETAEWAEHALPLITRMPLWNSSLSSCSRKCCICLNTLSHSYPGALCPVPPVCHMTAAGYESVKLGVIKLNWASSRLLGAFLWNEPTHVL